MSICIAIICVAAYISFPIPFTPVMITGQTIAINLIALILTPRKSFIVVLAYILLGAFDSLFLQEESWIWENIWTNRDLY